MSGASSSFQRKQLDKIYRTRIGRRILIIIYDLKFYLIIIMFLWLDDIDQINLITRVENDFLGSAFIGGEMIFE